mgnify:CR=1 FL=1
MLPAPVLVSSTKLMTAGGELLEVVRGGLGMALTVSVEDGALHFRSRRYFASLGGLRRVVVLPVAGGTLAPPETLAALDGVLLAADQGALYPCRGRPEPPAPQP